MMKMVGVLLVVLGTIIVLDLLWVGVLAKGLYQSDLKGLLASRVNVVGVVLLYVLLAGGVYLFVLHNSFVSHTFSVVVLGALFGLVVYGVYEFTNFALLASWPLRIVIVDTLWGGVICSLASLTGYLVTIK